MWLQFLTLLGKCLQAFTAELTLPVVNPRGAVGSDSHLVLHKARGRRGPQLRSFPIG